jgi:hypothetical protein
MSKTVSMKTNPRSKEPTPSDLDAFVHGNASTPPRPQKEAMKRLTIDVASSLHKRIRRACLEKDVDMASEIRRILEAQFPAE